MAKIAAIGVYVPRYRIEAAEINVAWGRGGGKGQKAVASQDEDALTMGIRAAQSCLQQANIEKNSLGAIYFASVSSGYSEYALASQAASVLGLDHGVSAADFGLTTRGVTSALMAAVDAIGAGRVRNALVIASDRLVAEPGSAYELNHGAGAGALLITSDGAVEIDQFASHTSDFVGRSRKEGSWHGLVDDRFIMKHGYIVELQQAIQQLNVDPSKYNHVVLQSPDGRWSSRFAKQLKLAPDALRSSAGQIGYAGTASFVIDLSLALESAEAEQRVLAVSYGPGGGDALSFSVSERLNFSGPVSELLVGDAKITYPEYLRMNKLLGGES